MFTQAKVLGHEDAEEMEIGIIDALYLFDHIEHVFQPINTEIAHIDRN